MAWVGEMKDAEGESGDEKRFDGGLAPSPEKRALSVEILIGKEYLCNLSRADRRLEK